MTQERERLQQLEELAQRMPAGGLLDPRRTIVAIVLELVGGMLARIEAIEAQQGRAH